MNTEPNLTSNEVERMLASLQIEFYTSAKQSAALADHKEQYRHYMDCIDNIISRYGVSILNKTESNKDE